MTVTGSARRMGARAQRHSRKSRCRHQVACSQRQMRASDNRLTSLPDSLEHLSRLRELHLRNNNLTSLPESIGTLQELRQMDFRGNPLTHLPAAIAALPRLEKLDLRWVDTLVLPAGGRKSRSTRLCRLLLMPGAWHGGSAPLHKDSLPQPCSSPPAGL